MTTGNDPYVEHLRGQLSAVLDDVTPPAAPTAAVKRRGKAIRTRRRVVVAAGLAVAVVAAALVPGLLRQAKLPGPVSPPKKNPKVTVRTIGRDAPHGLIAQGAINGKPWRITLSWQGKDLCFGMLGIFQQDYCGSKGSYVASWPATLDAANDGRTEALFGVVASRVRRVSVALSDDVVLNLRPVMFSGYRWIGVELPAQLAVTRVTAYARSGELAHAIPFIAVRGGFPSIVDWLRPGQPMPRQFTRLIGSGVSAGKLWSMTLHVGPWGQCDVLATRGESGPVDCSPPTRNPGATSGSGGPTEWWTVGAVRPRVAYLVVSMTDGSTHHVPTVQVGSLRFYAIVILGRPRIARWAAYDASGHRLYGGRGEPSFGHS